MSEGHLDSAVVVDVEEETYLKKRVDALRYEFADAVAELESLQRKLGDFEVRYDARIGIVLVELDQIELEITIYQRRLASLVQPPETWQQAEDETMAAFATERDRIEAEYQDAHASSQRAEELPPDPPASVTAEIRQLYRTLARQYHPDVATTDEERRVNDVAMKWINAAFEANNLSALQRLELELPRRTDHIPGETRGARRAWLIAEIARLEAAVVRTLSEIAGMKGSSLYQLWERVEQDGGVLNQLEQEIRSTLEARRAELDILVRTYRDMANQRLMTTDVAS